MKKLSIIFISIVIVLLTGCQHKLLDSSSSNENNKDTRQDENGTIHHHMHQNESDAQPMKERIHENEDTHRNHHMQMMGQEQTLQSSTGENELIVPPLLEPIKQSNDDVYYKIEAKEGKTEIFPNTKTNTLGYNGDFLGPAIRVQKGQNAHIAFKNSLKEDTTVHWHGLIVGGSADGGPHDVIQPGEERDITFKVQQEEATLWFHPHPLGKTAKQVYEGLAGLLLIEGKYDEQFLYGKNDFPLIIQDKTFTESYQLDYASAYHPNGTIGNTILMNGTINPKLTVPKEKIRLRLLNGSNTRSYTFSFSNKMSFEQIASDGGLLNEPMKMEAMTLAPAERAEIIADFSKMNDDVNLMAGEDIVVLPIHLKDKKSKNIAHPLDPAERVTITEEEKNLAVSKHIELFGMGPHVTINGKKFDPERIDFTQDKGVTEIWEVYNKPDMVGTLHPFHIHGTQFKIVSINGEKPPAHLQGYKDTISLQPGDKAKIAVKFEEPGVYMYHCHILEHEDNGMMGQVQVQ